MRIGLEKIENRFALVLLATERVRQLEKGSKPLVETKNENVVVVLREIAAGKVKTAKEDINADS